MEGKLRKMSEEAIESSWDILWIFLHRAREIPSILDDVLQRLLDIGS